MGWFYPKKRSAEWKPECTMQAMDTASLSPNLHLFVVFGIVISLLWLSNYTSYKAHPNHTAIYFQLFLLLAPILLLLFLLSCSNFRSMRSEIESLQRFVVSPWKLQHNQLAAAATAIAFLLIYILF